MLELLRNGDRTVTEIGQLFSATQSATSQHLAVLRRAGLVSRRREGRRQLYRVNPARLRPLIEWVATFEALGEGQSRRRR